MIEAYKKFKANGFECLPVKEDKSPLLSTSWKDGFEQHVFESAYGIGLICGERSGGLECFDFDNHFGDAKQIISRFIKLPEVNEIFTKHKLPIEETKNGGFHLLFRCDVNEGNRKLAQRLNLNERAEALIETRGEGGYFVSSPTPNYVVKKNDIYSISKISNIERAVLINSAMSFNEYTKTRKTEFEASDRPGDVYNQSPGSIAKMESTLENNGWTRIDDTKWTRPGKDIGVSATLGVVAPNVFYVFSSNADPFEPMKAYTPFQVLALLEFSGDFSAAATSLVPERHNKQVIEKEPDELEKILINARIDTRVPIERPPTILSIREFDFATVTDKRLFTLGNFSCIVGKAKSRKTFLINLFTASMIANVSDKLIAKRGGKILYFDTEQSVYDCYNVLKRIERMAGYSDKLIGFSLREFSPKERCQIIEYAFEKYGNDTQFCVIDGVADLSNAINDEDEATRVVTMLLRLTKLYNCHISTVIHQNKNNDFATGHLGSAVMKKAEILIAVTKMKDPIMSEVSCDLNRGIDFESFGMSIQDGLPSIETIEEDYESPFD